MVWIVFAVYLLLSVGGLLLVRTGGAQQLSLAQGLFSLQLSIRTLCGYLCYVGSFLLYMGVLIPRFNLTFIAPLATGLSYVMIMLASFFILHETISPLQWIGAAVVLAGLVMMNWKTA